MGTPRVIVAKFRSAGRADREIRRWMLKKVAADRADVFRHFEHSILKYVKLSW